MNSDHVLHLVTVVGVTILFVFSIIDERRINDLNKRLTVVEQAAEPGARP